MPTINIEGRRVKVDDSFLSLSPDEQNAAVDEIARSLGVGQESLPLDPTNAPVGMRTQPSTGLSRENGIPGVYSEADANAEMSFLTKSADNPFISQNYDAYIADTKAEKPYSTGGAAGLYRTLEAVTPMGAYKGLVQTALNPRQAGKRLDAFVRGAADTMTFGTADEIAAYLNAKTGLYGPQTYDDALTAERQRDAYDAKRYTGDRLVGQAAGAVGLGKGLGIGGGGTGSQMAQAGAGGAAYGFGSGEGGADNRAKSAAITGLLSAGTAGIVSGAGNMLAKRAATKAAMQAPTSAALKDEADVLFDAARSSGVTVTPQAGDRLIANMEMAAGRANPVLRPKTGGFVDDMVAHRGKGFDVQDIHERRMEIGLAMQKADPQDVRTLTRMKAVLDGFIDAPPAGAITGSAQGLATLRKAIDVSARQHKAQLIEQLLDIADRTATGTYTQSGMQNALKTQFGALHTQIIKGQVKGFTAEEVAIIREIGAKGTSSAAMNLLAKLAPRGVVSMGLGSGMGAAAGSIVAGPLGAAVGSAVPGAVGGLAARSVDKAALTAANLLRASAARGGATVLPQVPNALARYALPAATTATLGSQQILRPGAAASRR